MLFEQFASISVHDTFLQTSTIRMVSILSALYVLLYLFLSLLSLPCSISFSLCSLCPALSLSLLCLSVSSFPQNV